MFEYTKTIYRHKYKYQKQHKNTLDDTLVRDLTTLLGLPQIWDSDHWPASVSWGASASEKRKYKAGTFVLPASFFPSLEGGDVPVLPQFTLFLLRYYPSRRRSAPETAQFIIALEIIIWQGTTQCAVSALKVQCNSNACNARNWCNGKPDWSSQCRSGGEKQLYFKPLQCIAMSGLQLRKQILI